MRTAASKKLNSMPVRIAADCYEAVRTDAFERRITIAQLLANVIRKAYRLPGPPEARG